MGLNELPTLAILFVVGFVVLSFGAKITGDVATQMNSTSTGTTENSYYAAANGTSAILMIGSYAPLIGTVVAGAFVIGILVHSFTS